MYDVTSLSISVWRNLMSAINYTNSFMVFNKTNDDYVDDDRQMYATTMIYANISILFIYKIHNFS